jgi:hypothetical protein
MLIKLRTACRKSRGIACLLFLAPTVACQPEAQEELRGSLFFGAGEYLAELELHNGSVNIEASLGDVEIQGVSPQADKRLLLTVFGSVNQQDKHSLVLYDLGTRQTLTIAYGRSGHYLPGSGTLVYDDGVSLILAERDDEGWQKTEALRHAYNAPLLVTPLSATRFLYEIGGQGIHLYDTVSKRAMELSALGQRCQLDASLWDSQSERLLCRGRLDNGSYEYVMAGLDGAVTATLDLPPSRRLQPIAFLHDQGALVLTEIWRRKLSDRQNHAVWIYRLEDGVFYRLLDNQHLGRTVVYRPRSTKRSTSM